MKCTADEPLVVMDVEYEPVMLQNPKSFKAEIVERNEGRGGYIYAIIFYLKRGI